MSAAWDLVAEAAGRPGFLVLLAACIAAGLVRGFAGFGTALMFMPVATSVIEAPTALASMLIFDGFGAAALLPWGLRNCRGREVGRLFAGVAIGAPLGIWLLATLDAGALRWVISLLALGAGAVLASGWRWRGETPDWASYPVGWLSGLFGGVSGLSGVPVILFHLGREAGAVRLRADVIVLFVMASFVSVGLLAWRGMMGWDAVVLGLMLGPVFWAGTVAGARLFPLASEALFRRVAYAMIFASALVGLPVWQRLSFG